MTNAATNKLFFRLIVLTLMILSLWVLSGSTPNPLQEDKYIPVKISGQLNSVNAVIPVEIRCGKAHLITLDQLETFDCTLRNNTDKNITAANTIYCVILERNGTTNKDTFNSIIETFGEPEFKGANNVNRPGGEISVSPPGAMLYLNAIIKGVEIGIDYVEFEDKSTLGPNETGSKILKDFREGAIKYREWLNRRYSQNGKSIGAILPLLERDQSLPSELESLTPNQDMGAKSYRSRLRNIYQKRGSAEVEKVLN